MKASPRSFHWPLAWFDQPIYRLLAPVPEATLLLLYLWARAAKAERGEIAFDPEATASDLGWTPRKLQVAFEALGEAKLISSIGLNGHIRLRGFKQYNLSAEAPRDGNHDHNRPSGLTLPSEEGAWVIDESRLGELRAKYPSLDITREILKASAWLATKPRRPGRALEAFLENWLSRANRNSVLPIRRETPVGEMGQTAERRRARIRKLLASLEG